VYLRSPIRLHGVVLAEIAQSVQYGATDWRTGSIPDRGMDFFSAIASRLTLGIIQPRLQWVPRTLFPEVRRPGRETDHASPSSVDVKNSWCYINVPAYVFMALCLNKCRIRLNGVVLC